MQKQKQTNRFNELDIEPLHKTSECLARKLSVAITDEREPVSFLSL